MPKGISLKKVEIADLQKEINRRLKMLAKLQAKRDKLDAKIAEFEELLPSAAKVGKVGKKRGRKKGSRGPGRPKGTGKKAAKKTGKKVKRARNKPSLADILANAMKGKDKVGIQEAAKLAQDAGYKSKSKNFNLIVGMALKSDTRFKKVARGVYTVKG